MCLRKSNRGLRIGVFLPQEPEEVCAETEI